MTTRLDELRKLAGESIGAFGSADGLNFLMGASKEQRFIDAANPAAIIELLDVVEKMREALADRPDYPPTDSEYSKWSVVAYDALTALKK